MTMMMCTLPCLYGVHVQSVYIPPSTQRHTAAQSRTNQSNKKFNTYTYMYIYGSMPYGTMTALPTVKNCIKNTQKSSFYRQICHIYATCHI